MKLIEWRFESLVVPMIGIDNDLYCTTKAVCKALGVSKQRFRECYLRNKERVGEPLGTRNVDLREFIKRNREVLDVIRVKDDLNLWSDKQMFILSIKTNSERADRFQDELWDFAKQYARKTVITLEQYKELEERVESFEYLKHTVESLLQEREAAMTSIDQAASAAGRSLSAFRQTKPFRTNKPIISV